MKGKLTVAVTASLAVATGALTAGPADAAITAANNAVASVNYYVNAPSLSGITAVTPESATIEGSVDTGGSPGSFLPVGGGLSWDGGAFTIAAGTPFASGSATNAITESGNYVPVDGLPVSGSNSSIAVKLTDASISTSAPTYTTVGNGGADNQSVVTVEYDPVSDYVSNNNAPGSQSGFGSTVQVPTAAGTSGVSVLIGAFGASQQNNTGNVPLVPNTQYYYWIAQQAGATTAATEVNVAQWTGATTNPTYKCIPNAVLSSGIDSTLTNYYTNNPTISADGTTAPALNGGCTYTYGNVSSALVYRSPNGEFTTPKIGSLNISRHATLTGNKVPLTVKDASLYKASGTIQLQQQYTDAPFGTAKFSLAAGKKGTVTVKLNRAGVKAAKAKKAVVALSLTSNWGQPTATATVTLHQG